MDASGSTSNNKKCIEYALIGMLGERKTTIILEEAKKVDKVTLDDVLSWDMEKDLSLFETEAMIAFHLLQAYTTVEECLP